jgi:hypothetical protein
MRGLTRHTAPAVPNALAELRPHRIAHPCGVAPALASAHPATACTGTAAARFMCLGARVCGPGDQSNEAAAPDPLHDPCAAHIGAARARKRAGSLRRRCAIRLPRTRTNARTQPTAADRKAARACRRVLARARACRLYRQRNGRARMGFGLVDRRRSALLPCVAV